MTTSEILHAISVAASELERLYVCSIGASIAEPFAQAISAMGICICGGAYDMDTNQKWFYLDNKHKDYKI